MDGIKIRASRISHRSVNDLDGEATESRDVAGLLDSRTVGQVTVSSIRLDTEGVPRRRVR